MEVSSRNWVKTPTKEQDIRDYVAAIYAYWGEKERFYESYRDYKDIIKKFYLKSLKEVMRVHFVIITRCIILLCACSESGW